MRIAVLGQGMMGSAIGAQLRKGGAEVLTPLEGRSEASRARAQDAGMNPATLPEAGRCDMILSIVPPDAAVEVCRSILPHVAQSTLFVDCNAIHPDEARRIGALVEQAGAHFADGAILGGPPSADATRLPLFYLAGDGRYEAARLGDFGLRVELLDSPAGSASALKMALAGISKGMTGLLAQMTMLAQAEGLQQPFLAQLRRSQPGLVAWGEAQFPQLRDKAGRWSKEMEILADMASVVPGAHAIFEGLGELFSQSAAERPPATSAVLATAIAPPRGHAP